MTSLLPSRLRRTILPRTRATSLARCGGAVVVLLKPCLLPQLQVTSMGLAPKPPVGNHPALCVMVAALSHPGLVPGWLSRVSLALLKLGLDLRLTVQLQELLHPAKMEAKVVMATASLCKLAGVKGMALSRPLLLPTLGWVCSSTQTSMAAWSSGCHSRSIRLGVRGSLTRCAT